SDAYRTMSAGPAGASSAALRRGGASLRSSLPRGSTGAARTPKPPAGKRAVGRFVSTPGPADDSLPPPGSTAPANGAHIPILGGPSERDRGATPSDAGLGRMRSISPATAGVAAPTRMDASSRSPLRRGLLGSTTAAAAAAGKDAATAGGRSGLKS